MRSARSPRASATSSPARVEPGARPGSPAAAAFSRGGAGAARRLAERPRRPIRRSELRESTACLRATGTTGTRFSSAGDRTCSSARRGQSEAGRRNVEQASRSCRMTRGSRSSRPSCCFCTSAGSGLQRPAGSSTSSRRQITSASGTAPSRAIRSAARRHSPSAGTRRARSSSGCGRSRAPSIRLLVSARPSHDAIQKRVTQRYLDALVEAANAPDGGQGA